jgi:hypothetical protein
MKRCWLVRVPGYAPFMMIMMSDDDDPLRIARLTWPNATVE